MLRSILLFVYQKAAWNFW